jgi:dipeptidyl aminopeptidase/acylaminoacyl peptidase
VNALLDAGFLVLMPDYRGSTGHGREWCRVSSEERGVVDVDDVMAAKRFLKDSGLAAPGRVAVAGDSYGGYLTLMALARDSRDWACAASLCGLWDPVNLHTAWAVDNEKLPDLAQRTPLNLLQQMRAPLLVIHGALDNMSTVDEVSRASAVLQSNGIPCEVDVLEDAHCLPLHANEAAKRLVTFLLRHMSQQ